MRPTQYARTEKHILFDKLFYCYIGLHGLSWIKYPQKKSRNNSKKS